MLDEYNSSHHKYIVQRESDELNNNDDPCNNTIYTHDFIEEAKEWGNRDGVKDIDLQYIEFKGSK